MDRYAGSLLLFNGSLSPILAKRPLGFVQALGLEDSSKTS
jgi:hypothetical protein